MGKKTKGLGKYTGFDRDTYSPSSRIKSGSTKASQHLQRLKTWNKNSKGKLYKDG